MDRRGFLTTAIIGGLAGRIGRAADCGGDCKLPEINLGPIDPSTAGRVERPAARIERPLWSNLSGPDRARLLSTLRTAYKCMSQMPPEDPRSMAFQAWLHQYFCCSHRHGGNRAFPGAGPDIHSTSDFLPWHRAFLFFHERIIQGVSGRRDFRLPVWDWESPRQGYQAPWPYDSMPLPSMPCKCSPRSETVPSVMEICLKEWLWSRSFDEFMGPQGPALPAAGAKPGCATVGPHSGIHLSLGGYMGQVPVAAIDPVFYAHHANIDRYWEHWRCHYKGKPGFTEHWPASSEYYFYDGFRPRQTPRLVRVTPFDLLDLDALGYSYQRPTVQIPALRSIPARHVGKDANLLRFDRSSLKTLSPFLTALAAMGDANGQTFAARVDIRIQDTQPGFYFVAVADTAGSSPVPISSFAAFVDCDAGATRICSGTCPSPAILAKVRPLIEKSTPFQLMYAVAKGAPDEKLLQQGSLHAIVGNWVAAKPPVEFEFLVPGSD